MGQVQEASQGNHLYAKETILSSVKGLLCAFPTRGDQHGSENPSGKGYLHTVFPQI